MLLYPAPRGTRLAVQAARVVFPAADREEIAAATAEIFASGSLTLGPYTRQFEAAFAAAHSPGGAAAAARAMAVSSGTAALEIILRSIGVTGRDVIVPANTFFATAEAALRAGGRPVFADIDAQTFALSPQTLLAALTPQTAAVMLVHIGGLITPARRRAGGSAPSAASRSSRTPRTRTAPATTASPPARSGRRPASPSSRRRSSPAARAA